MCAECVWRSHSNGEFGKHDAGGRFLVCFWCFHVFSQFPGETGKMRASAASLPYAVQKYTIRNAVKHLVSCIRWHCLWYCTNTRRTTDPARMTSSLVLVVYSGRSSNSVNQFFNCLRRMQTYFVQLSRYLLADVQIIYSVHVQKWKLHESTIFHLFWCTIFFSGNSSSEINNDERIRK